MELSRYLRVIRHRLWMIVACPVVAALTAGIVSFALPPVYEAHATLLVLPSNLGAADPNVVPLTPDQILRTYSLLLTQRKLLDSVIADLGLKIRSDDLARKIKATPQPNSTILDVGVDDTNPALARDIANNLV